MGKEKEVIHYSPKPGETFCHIAVAHGFPDCEKVRAANSHRDFAELPFLTGEESDLLIPPIEEGVDNEPDKTETEYKLENYPPPNVTFIKEQGAGYPDNPPDPDDKNYDPHYPNRDQKLTKLNVTNYHIDWAGNGDQTQAANSFAAAGFYGYHEPSSRDPDHFKVQVYDNKAKGGDEVTVKLFAMRPVYKGKADGKKEIEFTGKHELPDTDERKLEVKWQAGGQNELLPIALPSPGEHGNRPRRPASASLADERLLRRRQERRGEALLGNPRSDRPGVLPRADVQADRRQEALPGNQRGPASPSTARCPWPSTSSADRRPPKTRSASRSISGCGGS